MPKPLTSIPIVIPAGDSISAGTEIGSTAIVALIMPADWSPALATIQASIDGVEYFDAYAGNEEATFNVVPNSMHWTEPDKWRGVNFVKVRSGTAGNPVVQDGDRTFRVIAEGAALAKRPARKRARR